jgi:hypothetical protein
MNHHWMNHCDFVSLDGVFFESVRPTRHDNAISLLCLLERGRFHGMTNAIACETGGLWNNVMEDHEAFFGGDMITAMSNDNNRLR